MHHLHYHINKHAIWLILFGSVLFLLAMQTMLASAIAQCTPGDLMCMNLP